MTAIVWRYDFVPSVHTMHGVDELDARCDDGWEPFAVTSAGGGDITVHIRRQEKNGSQEVES